MSDLLQLARIESKLDRLLAGPLDPIVGVREGMRLTGTRSPQAFHRLMRKWGVHPPAKGKYRRVDIDNAMGRQALRLARQIDADMAHENITEAQRPFPKPAQNP